MASQTIVYEKGDVVGHSELGRGIVLKNQVVKGDQTDGLKIMFDVSGIHDDVDPGELYSLDGPWNIREPLRIKLTYDEAIRIFNGMVKIWNRDPNNGERFVENDEELMDALGCGRASFGVPVELLTNTQKALLSSILDDVVIMVADKEVYPPVFRIGEC